MQIMKVVLACCAILSSSVLVIGQGPVPFRAMMQSAGTPPMRQSHTGRRQPPKADFRPTRLIPARLPQIVLVAAGAVVIALMPLSAAL